nr:hypothetical protein [Lachnospiraceae bacterium]
KLKEEEARKAKEEQARKAKEEQARKAKEEQEKKAKEEQARKAKEEQEKRAKEEQARKAKEEQEKKLKEEQEKKLKEEQEIKVKEETHSYPTTMEEDIEQFEMEEFIENMINPSENNSNDNNINENEEDNDEYEVDEINDREDYLEAENRFYEERIAFLDDLAKINPDNDIYKNNKTSADIIYNVVTSQKQLINNDIASLLQTYSEEINTFPPEVKNRFEQIVSDLNSSLQFDKEYPTAKSVNILGTSLDIFCYSNDDDLSDEFIADSNKIVKELSKLSNRIAKSEQLDRLNKQYDNLKLAGTKLGIKPDDALTHFDPIEAEKSINTNLYSAAEKSLYSFSKIFSASAKCQNEIKMLFDGKELPEELSKIGRIVKKRHEAGSDLSFKNAVIFSNDLKKAIDAYEANVDEITEGLSPNEKSMVNKSINQLKQSVTDNKKSISLIGKYGKPQNEKKITSFIKDQSELLKNKYYIIPHRNDQQKANDAYNDINLRINQLKKYYNSLINYPGNPDELYNLIEFKRLKTTVENVLELNADYSPLVIDAAFQNLKDAAGICTDKISLLGKKTGLDDFRADIAQKISQLFSKTIVNLDRIDLTDSLCDQIDKKAVINEDFIKNDSIIINNEKDNPEQDEIEQNEIEQNKIEQEEIIHNYNIENPDNNNSNEPAKFKNLEELQNFVEDLSYKIIDGKGGQIDEYGEKIPTESLGKTIHTFGSYSVSLGTFFSDEVKDKMNKFFNESLETAAKAISNRLSNNDLEDYLSKIPDIRRILENELKNSKNKNPYFEVGLKSLLNITELIEYKINIDDLHNSFGGLPLSVFRLVEMDTYPGSMLKNPNGPKDMNELNTHLVNTGLIAATDSYNNFAEKYLATEKARRSYSYSLTSNNTPEQIAEKKLLWERSKDELIKAEGELEKHFKNIYYRYSNSNANNLPAPLRIGNLYDNLSMGGRGSNIQDTFIRTKEAIKQAYPGLKENELFEKTNSCIGMIDSIDSIYKNIEKAQNNQPYSGKLYRLQYMAGEALKQFTPKNLPGLIESLKVDNIPIDDYLHAMQEKLGNECKKAADDYQQYINSHPHEARNTLDSFRNIKKLLDQATKAGTVKPRMYKQTDPVNRLMLLDGKVKQEIIEFKNKKSSLLNNEFGAGLDVQIKKLSSSTWYKFFVPNSKEYENLDFESRKMQHFIKEASKNNITEERKLLLTAAIQKSAKDIKQYVDAYFTKYPDALDHPEHYNEAEQKRFAAAKELKKMSDNMLKQLYAYNDKGISHTIELQENLKPLEVQKWAPPAADPQINNNVNNNNKVHQVNMNDIMNRNEGNKVKDEHLRKNKTIKETDKSKNPFEKTNTFVSGK